MTLARLGDENLQRYGEYEALAFEGRRLTNVDQQRAACRVAHALRRLGVDVAFRSLDRCQTLALSFARPAVIGTDGVIVDKLVERS